MRLSLPELKERAVQRARQEGVGSLLRVGARFLVFGIVDESMRFRWRTRLRYRGQQLRYRAPADPWKRLGVDPQSLSTANYELSQYAGLGLIRDGGWDADANNIPVEEYWSVQGLRERFLDGRAWEDTRYYEKAREAFDERGEFWGYEDLETFKRERCEYVDDLYAAIDRDGYRPNDRAIHAVPETGFKQKPHQHLEVLVSIGRSGELLFRDGHHRLALAQILEVDEIPIHVLGRHRDWQHTRDRVATAEAVADLGPELVQQLSHPDLSDVTSTDLRRAVGTDGTVSA